MTVIRLHTSIAMDTLLPRDAMCIVPHVNTTLGMTDAQVLANDWAAAVLAQMGGGTSPMIHVKAYDAQKPKPNYPIGETILNPDTFKVSSGPREVCLCLSFYSHDNVKRKRGRLYLPFSFIQLSGGPGLRPTQTMMDSAMAFATRLEALGGVDVDWSVYSRRDNTARAVTNYWVDDEWDIQRSRGLRGTTRSEATTAEDSTVRTRQLLY